MSAIIESPYPARTENAGFFLINYRYYIAIISFIDNIPHGNRKGPMKGGEKDGRTTAALEWP